MTAGMMREMSWQVDEEVNRDKTGEADEMNLEADSKDEVINIWTSCLWISRKIWLVDATPEIIRHDKPAWNTKSFLTIFIHHNGRKKIF